MTTLGNFTAHLPEAVEQLDQVERYAPGIRPIRVSFTMMFDALRRVITGVESETKTTRDSRCPATLV
jgi:hypothetical protein